MKRVEAMQKFVKDYEETGTLAAEFSSPFQMYTQLVFRAADVAEHAHLSWESLLHMQEKGFRANLYIYHRVLQIAAQIGDTELADAIVSEIHAKSVPDIKTYSMHIQAYTRAHNFDRILEIFDDMRAAKLDPDPRLLEYMVVQAAKWRRRDKFVEYANELLMSPLHERPTLNMYYQLLKACKKLDVRDIGLHCINAVTLGSFTERLDTQAPRLAARIANAPVPGAAAAPAGEGEGGEQGEAVTEKM